MLLVRWSGAGLGSIPPGLDAFTPASSSSSDDRGHSTGSSACSGGDDRCIVRSSSSHPESTVLNGGRSPTTKAYRLLPHVSYTVIT